MLTRLKVTGFKNLVDVDIRFGPFTCIAGANGTGKSNLFDAVTFLSALADRPLVDAALSVRDESGRMGDLRSLFHRVGDQYDDTMSFEAEMILPAEGVDDLGQPARASITFVRYSLALSYREDDSLRSLGSLEIQKEELVQINQGEAPKKLLFPHKPAWRKSAVRGRRTSPFISTEVEEGKRVIKLHQDGVSGRPLRRSAANLPRTVISIANAAESPTALLARREMQSWRLLQLEPTALRKPDEFTSPSRLGVDGSHLAATLFRLANRRQQEAGDEYAEVGQRAYARVANRLSELIDDVYRVNVERDDRRELLTLQVTDKGGTTHPARALSDGTLRFLALAVLELDPEATGLLCLEEPENGIHPERIPAILGLLQSIATDVDEPIGNDNPLRQVIINTHSPSVVKLVPEGSLIVAMRKDMLSKNRIFKGVRFGCLPGTWRDENAPIGEHVETVSKGALLAYLNPVSQDEEDAGGDGMDRSRARGDKRVIDRPDMRQLALRFP